MNPLFIFLMSTAGLVWILNKSKLFKSTREYYTKAQMKNPQSLSLWFISSLLECSGCCAVWACMPVGACVYFNFYYPLYPCMAAIFTVMVISVWQKIERS